MLMTQHAPQAARGQARELFLQHFVVQQHVSRYQKRRDQHHSWACFVHHPVAPE